MTDFDISPEAVERIAELEAAIDSIETSHGLTSGGNLWRFWRKKSQEIIAKNSALSAALTQSRAETSAAYEQAADVAYFRNWSITGDMIRALATPDQSSALAAVIAAAKAEALGGPWEDKPDALTEAVRAAHPVFTKDYKTYTEALELVSNRHGKGALVGLVNYLMAQNKTAEARVDVSTAALIVADAIDADMQAFNALCLGFEPQPNIQARHFFSKALRHYSNAVLAAIPQGDTTND